MMRDVIGIPHDAVENGTQTVPVGYRLDPLRNVWLPDITDLRGLWPTINVGPTPDTPEAARRRSSRKRV